MESGTSRSNDWHCTCGIDSGLKEGIKPLRCAGAAGISVVDGEDWHAMILALVLLALALGLALAVVLVFALVLALGLARGDGGGGGLGLAAASARRGERRGNIENATFKFGARRGHRSSKPKWLQLVAKIFGRLRAESGRPH